MSGGTTAPRFQFICKYCGFGYTTRHPVSHCLPVLISAYREVAHEGHHALELVGDADTRDEQESKASDCHRHKLTQRGCHLADGGVLSQQLQQQTFYSAA